MCSIPLNALSGEPSQLTWLTDYHAALDTAGEQRKMTLLWFFDPHATAENDQLERDVLRNPRVLERLASTSICVKLPQDTLILSNGKWIPVLDHPAFADLERAPGLAMIDMTDEDDPLFRQVVSIYPLNRQSIDADQLLALLQLPHGTITQRTLIFAVRTHAEQPASAASHLSPLLSHETESHSQHQANIRLQGHHQWESRFHSINAQLPGGLSTTEVCAESWPGQGLLEAALECVDSWRQSPGHWDAVSRRHVLFGYDMKRGANGVWYATGIFADRH